MDSLESAVDEIARTSSGISGAKWIGYLRTGGEEEAQIVSATETIRFQLIQLKGGQCIFPFIVLQPFVWIRGISLLLGAQRLLFKAGFGESYS